MLGKRNTVFFLSLILISVYGYADNEAVIQGEKRAVQIQCRLDSLLVVRHQQLGKAQILSQRIGLYRSKTELNAREHRNIERLLQQSQTLGKDINRLSAEIKALEMDLQDQIEILMSAMNREMEIMAAAVNNPQFSEAQKQAAALQLNPLMTQKAYWEKQYPIIEPVSELGLNLKPKPWDSSEKLKIKGNLLQDQAKRYEGEMVQVQNRIESLEKEQMIRQQVQELAQDMALFNAQEELLGRSGAQILTSNYYDFWGPESDSREVYTDEAKDNGLSAGTSTRFMPQDLQTSDDGYGNHSIDALETAISQLTAYQKRMAQKADSLRQKAGEFFQAAEAGAR